MNLPNALSVFRLCLVPVFLIVYFSPIPHAGRIAVLIYAAAALSDVLDGYFARKYSLTSTLGKILDPLGDKLMTLAVLIAITIDKVIPIWALIVFALKELLMAAGGLLLLKKISDMPPSNHFGKLSTIVFFAVCVILIVFREFFSPPAATALISFAIAVMLVALFSYFIKFLSFFSSDS